MLLIYIFAIVLIFSLVPYVISMTKKASAAASMKRTLESRGCKIIPTGPLWYMGTVTGKKCDFYVIFDKRVIAVKIVTFISPNVFLQFIDKTSYALAEIKNKATVDKNSVTLKTHKKRAYDFKSKLPKMASGLPMAKVILVTEPHPLQITMKSNDSVRALHPGEKTPEGDYHTTDSFTYLFK